MNYTSARQRTLWHRMQGRTVHDWLTLSSSLWARLKSTLYYPLIFGSFGSGSILRKPIAIRNPRYIHIGRHVRIAPGVRLEVVLSGPTRIPQLIIADNVNLEQCVHIVCHNRILIERDVSVTGFASIVDTTHPADGLRASEKMGDVVADDEASVEIGQGAFIGMGARILPDVRIGKGAVIGANAVVTRSVPDFAIAAGVPAIIMRRRQMI